MLISCVTRFILFVIHFVELGRNPPDGVSVGLIDDNLFKWELMIVGMKFYSSKSSFCPVMLIQYLGPTDTLYEGGFFQAVLEFPADFPNMPPSMTFKSAMWHPNGIYLGEFMICFTFWIHIVYEDGKVCISILHPPGEDKYNEQVSLFTLVILACNFILRYRKVLWSVGDLYWGWNKL